MKCKFLLIYHICVNNKISKSYADSTYMALYLNIFGFMLLSTQSGDICLPKDCLANFLFNPESVLLISLLDISALAACDKTHRKRPETRTHSIALALNCSFLKDLLNTVNSNMFIVILLIV